MVGRLWAERMKAKFGTVVTENKGGGGGVIGATEVARSTPNGETLLFGNSQHPGHHSGHRREAALRSGEGFPGGLHHGDLADLDRGA